MSKKTIELEELRLQDIHNLKDYNWIHERHLVFPEIFEDRKHKKIIDMSGGIGIVGKRIQEYYDAEIICNDVSPKCLDVMKKNNLATVSFDLDNKDISFPFPNQSFDAVISLATIEHLYHVDYFLKEINRILTDTGYLYISSPNYSGLFYLMPFLFSGKTFHNPLKEHSRYEFYAHIRYFTYKTLIEFISSLDFVIDTVYLPLPQASSKYLKLKEKSKIKAGLFRFFMFLLYSLFSPRWASEPILCFRKSTGNKYKTKPKKVILSKVYRGL